MLPQSDSCYLGCCCSRARRTRATGVPAPQKKKKKFSICCEDKNEAGNRGVICRKSRILPRRGELTPTVGLLLLGLSLIKCVYAFLHSLCYGRRFPVNFFALRSADAQPRRGGGERGTVRLLLDFSVLARVRTLVGCVRVREHANKKLAYCKHLFQHCARIGCSLNRKKWWCRAPTNCCLSITKSHFIAFLDGAVHGIITKYSNLKRNQRNTFPDKASTPRSAPLLSGLKYSLN